VSYGWRQDLLAQNAEDVSRLGKELYDRLQTQAGHFGALRGGLERAVEAYNRAIASFESRVLVSARRFKDLGAATGDEIEELQPVEKALRSFEP
jgi:DNA recombination protein RmuC